MLLISHIFSKFELEVYVAFVSRYAIGNSLKKKKVSTYNNEGLNKAFKYCGAKWSFGILCSRSHLHSTVVCKKVHKIGLYGVKWP